MTETKSSASTLGELLFPDAPERESLLQLARHALWKVAAPLPDGPFIRLKYRSIMGRWPDLENPKSFTERLQARKLFDRDPLYGQLVDKHKAKDYVAAKIGKEFVIPSLWVGTDLTAVSWPDIPLPAIVKPNHASGLGKLLYCEQDIASLLADNPARRWLATDHSAYNREWAYRLVRPQIMIEPLMLDRGRLPTTFNLDVFNGEVAQIDVISYIDDQEHVSTYDPDWTQVPLENVPRSVIANEPVAKPARLDEILDAAARLGAGFDYVRVDFLTGLDWIKFSELTFYPSGGFDAYLTHEQDLALGAMWDRACARESTTTAKTVRADRPVPLRRAIPS